MARAARRASAGQIAPAQFVKPVVHLGVPFGQRSVSANPCALQLNPAGHRAQTLAGSKV
ncbi:MAG: hypothetical protein M3Y06_11030 [Actinomycetota bacterium]|nr:hypothetical protein [Actinomycetota bacterium]